MSGDALALMLATMVLIWGGLGASVAFLARRPEATDVPEGGDDDPVAPD